MEIPTVNLRFSTMHSSVKVCPCDCSNNWQRVYDAYVVISWLSHSHLPTHIHTVLAMVVGRAPIDRAISWEYSEQCHATPVWTQLAPHLSDSQLAAIERLSAALVDSVSLHPLPLAHGG